MTIRTFEDFANSGEISSIYIGGTNAATDKVMTSGDIATSEDWIDITSFSNSWVAYNTITYPVKYKKLKNQLVIIDGLVMSGTFGNGDGGLGEVFVLPAGYRPEKTIISRIASSDNTVLLFIYPSGSVVFSSQTGTEASTSWTSLSTTTFLAEV